jgi:outer membrane protein OmpA-like peptidoglycan-associated protein
MPDQTPYEAVTHVSNQYAIPRLVGILTNVLTSAAAQRIDFWLGSIHVDGRGLSSVVQALKDGRIDVTIAQLQKGAAAEYANATKFFRFPTATWGLTPSDRKAMLHESIHAMQDLAGGQLWSERGSVFTYESENEAAAYVGGALFDIYSGIPLTSNVQVFIFADQIGQSIKGKPNAVVSSADAAVLRTLISAHPVYFNDGRFFSYRTFARGFDDLTINVPASPDGPVSVTQHEDRVYVKLDGDALFDFGKYIIKPQVIPFLRTVGAQIQAKSGWKVSVEGHTDSIGDPVTNRRLSEQRAQAVMEWLIVNKFVAAGNVSRTGFAATRPVKPNKNANGSDNPAGRSANRRVEVVLSKI